MTKKATFCLCLNTYTIKDCDKKNCKQSYYWKQGIGDIGGKATE